MKQIYNQMTKAMALAALFLIGGVNAWASESWVGYVSGKGKSVSLTITTEYADKFVSNLQAKADAQITYSFQYDSPSLVGVKVESTNKLYLKPTTDGFMNLRIACANGNPLTVTIHDNTTDTDVASVNVVTPTVTNTYYGETVLFEVKENHEYVLNASSGTYYVTVVTKIESSDVAVVNENMSASEMQAAIGSGKTMVKMNRTLKAGVWNTFSSPIKLGPNAMNAELKCSEAYELGAFDATTNTITFTKSDEITAGVPYLIKPTEAVSVISVSNRSNPATYNPQTVTKGNLSFVAALASTDLEQVANSFFLSGEHFYRPAAGNGTMKGLRAYFTLANASVKDINYIFEDDATGIITIENDPFQENGNVYTIDGRNMGNAKNLTPGIYVKNGRKFIVK